jgi:hypothetical protein
MKYLAVGLDGGGFEGGGVEGGGVEDGGVEDGGVEDGGVEDGGFDGGAFDGVVGSVGDGSDDGGGWFVAGASGGGVGWPVSSASAGSPPSEPPHAAVARNNAASPIEMRRFTVFSWAGFGCTSVLAWHTDRPTAVAAAADSTGRVPSGRASSAGQPIEAPRPAGIALSPG